MREETEAVRRGHARMQGASGRWPARIFEQMQAANCKPDFITFTALVSAYEKGGQWMRALQVHHLHLCICY